MFALNSRITPFSLFTQTSSLCAITRSHMTADLRALFTYSNTANQGFTWTIMVVLVLELEDHPNLALGHNHRKLTLPGSRKVGQSNLTMPSATRSLKSVLPSVKIGLEIRAVTLLLWCFFATTTKPMTSTMRLISLRASAHSHHAKYEL